MTSHVSAAEPLAQTCYCFRPADTRSLTCVFESSTELHFHVGASRQEGVGRLLIARAVVVAAVSTLDAAPAARGAGRISVLVECGSVHTLENISIQRIRANGLTEWARRWLRAE